MLKNICRQTNQIIKRSYSGLLAFFFVFIIFSLGLFSLKKMLTPDLHGILRYAFSSFLTFLCEAALSPVAVGAYEWIGELVNGKTPPMKEAFSRFSDLLSIIEAQKTFLTVIFTFRISVVPSAAMFFILLNNPQSSSNILFFILSILLSLRLLCGFSAMLHILINAPHISTFRAVRLSFSAMKGRFPQFMKLSGIYIMLIAACIFSFGILLIFALPYMFCSAAVFCDTVFEENKLYKYNLYY